MDTLSPTSYSPLSTLPPPSSQLSPPRKLHHQHPRQPMQTVCRGLGRWATMRAPPGAAQLPSSYLATTAPAARLPRPPSSLPSWLRAHFSRSAALVGFRAQRSALHPAPHVGGTGAGPGGRCSGSANGSVSAGEGCGPVFGCWGGGWASTQRRPFRASTAVHAAAAKNAADLVKRITRGAVP